MLLSLQTKQTEKKLKDWKGNTNGVWVTATDLFTLSVLGYCNRPLHCPKQIGWVEVLRKCAVLHKIPFFPHCKNAWLLHCFHCLYCLSTKKTCLTVALASLVLLPFHPVECLTAALNLPWHFCLLPLHINAWQLLYSLAQIIPFTIMPDNCLHRVHWFWHSIQHDTNAWLHYCIHWYYSAPHPTPHHPNKKWLTLFKTLTLSHTAETPVTLCWYITAIFPYTNAWLLHHRVQANSRGQARIFVSWPTESLAQGATVSTSAFIANTCHQC